MPVKDYCSDLLVRPANPDYAANYLKASLEEMLQDGDREAFLVALRNVVEAKAKAQVVAHGSDIADVDLQHQLQVLKDTNNPSVETLLLVLDVVGLKMEFKPA